jgi:hypothetical protein
MAISESDIDKVLAYLRDNAEKDAQARAERYYMEEYLKVVKAQQQAQAGDVSVAAAEVKARVSSEYIAALDAYKTAVYEDERRRFLRGAAEAKLEAFRTLEATRRAESKGYQ